MTNTIRLLATLFGQLTKRMPDSDGGLYAYVKHEFGDFAGRRPSHSRRRRKPPGRRGCR